MDIQFLGHSSFRIATSLAGVKTAIVTDPFSDSIGFKFPLVSANIVTVSHHHDDHDQVASVKDYKKVIDGPGEYEVMGVSIIGFGSYHDDKKGSQRGKNTIYVIESEGLRLCHLGDLGHDLGEKLLEDIGEIDVLMIPVGGVYTIDAKKATEIAQKIDANIVLPMHYQTKGLDKKTFSELTSHEEFTKAFGSDAEILTKLSVKKSGIGEEKRIIIFDKK